MLKNPSSEANNPFGIQKFPVLWKSKRHYRIYKVRPDKSTLTSFLRLILILLHLFLRLPSCLFTISSVLWFSELINKREKYGGTILWNVGKHLPNNTAQQPKNNMVSVSSLGVQFKLINININTGRFIMFSVFTNICNKKTKRPTLVKLFTATEKLKKDFFTTRDVRCLHHGWHRTRRYDIQVLATHASTWVHRYSSLPLGTDHCSSESIEYFPCIASRFFIKLFVTIPVAPIVTGIIAHFKFHIRCIPIPKLLYFNFFSASFYTTFLSAGIAVTSLSVCTA
jgi:hypothetical protein